MAKPFSQACENNKTPILEVLEQYLKEPGDLLEIGSGTGQHALWLSQNLPHLSWQPSDMEQHLPGIRSWCADGGTNLLEPMALDVRDSWPDRQFDAVFTANTFHIMAAPLVTLCIQQASKVLRPGARMFVYGPFNYAGRFTSESNARFNEWLQARDPASAIRDIEWIITEMSTHGLQLEQDHEMPANNRLLVFRRENIPHPSHTG